VIDLVNTPPSSIEDACSTEESNLNHREAGPIRRQSQAH